MGQFLTVGICSEFSFSAKKINKDFTEEMLNEKLGKKFDLSLYDKTYSMNKDNMDKIDHIFYKIKPEILLENILDYMKQQFGLYKQHDVDIEEFATAIKGKSAAELIELAEEKRFMYYQLNPYFYEYVSTNWHSNRINIDVTLISTFSAGKISMESYNYLFQYFERTIKKAIERNPLSGAVRVMISQ